MPEIIDNKLKKVGDFLKDSLCQGADVRSSYYLESVATEFDVQGLELVWAAT